MNETDRQTICFGKKELTCSHSPTMVVVVAADFETSAIRWPTTVVVVVAAVEDDEVCDRLRRHCRGFRDSSRGPKIGSDE